eukprot:scaffold1850_cov194-Pinguiococcus_pyrenoidosus.AAC.37
MPLPTSHSKPSPLSTLAPDSSKIGSWRSCMLPRSGFKAAGASGQTFFRGLFATMAMNKAARSPA